MEKVFVINILNWNSGGLVDSVLHRRFSEILELSVPRNLPASKSLIDHCSFHSPLLCWRAELSSNIQKMVAYAPKNTVPRVSIIGGSVMVSQSIAIFFKNTCTAPSNSWILEMIGNFNKTMTQKYSKTEEPVVYRE